MNHPWYQKKHYIILLLILVPPLGITLVWLSRWNRNLKIISTVISALILLGVLVDQSTQTSKGGEEDNNTITQSGNDVEKSGKSYLNIMDLIGQPMTELSQKFDVNLNVVGNLTYETDQYKLLIETHNGQTSSYVIFGVKELGYCKTDRSVLKHVDKIMVLAGLEPSLKGNPTNLPSDINLGTVVYGDYPSPYRIKVTCPFEDGYYEATIGLKNRY